MCDYKIDVEVVMKAAQGRWDQILWNLCPALQPAIEACPNHVACPIHGGNNGFRFFKDFKSQGSCICNSCGSFDGLHILMAVNSWSFFTALKAVNDFLKLPEGISVAQSVESFDGKIVFLGMATLRNGSSCFSVKLATDKGIKAFWGTDLKRACCEASLGLNDNARLSRLGSKTFMFKGKECRKTLWSATRLISDEEREEKLRKTQDEAKRRSNLIASKWDAASPINPRNKQQEPLIRYLDSRNILLDRPELLNNLRFSPSEAYYDDKGVHLGNFPCMIAAVRNTDGKIITLHRTFLTEKGTKISIGVPKKLMALPSGETINGAIISFGHVSKDGILCVAEGIETALSVVKATNYACDSCISANGLASFVPSSDVKAVFIFADKDRSLTGQHAAEKLRRRMIDNGIPCVICLPPTLTDEIIGKGVDWNDTIRTLGESAFPFRNENPHVNFA